MTAVAVAPRLAPAGAGTGSGVDDEGPGGDGAATLPGPLGSAVAALHDALDTLLAVDPDDVPGRGAERIASVLHSVAERAAAGVTGLLPRIERDGRWALDGDATYARWVARQLGLSVGAARTRVRVARALHDHLPRTLEAALSGEVGSEAASTLGRAATSDARRAVLADPEHGCNEAFLLDQARVLAVDDLRAVLRVWSHRADPESDERGFREAAEREHLTLSRLPDGYHLDGMLTVEHGQQLSTALAAVTPVPAASDTRSAAQRRAQALADLARTVLEHHPVGAGRVARPRVAVHVDHGTLARLVAESLAREAGTANGGDGVPARFAPEDLRRGAFFEDGTVVPRAVLDRLACDGELHRILFGPDGEVLDVGRSRRIFSGPVRAAVVARDGHCAFDGCTAPPSISEVHHVRHWARDGGRTEPDNGVLLCYHHHELVHRLALGIARVDGAWQFADRHGTVLRR